MEKKVPVPEIKIQPPRNPILILEDTKESQDLLLRLCNKMGLPCELAENGEIGLKMTGEKEYSIYIVDLMMPVMDGKTFIHKLKEKDPDAVILVQTALDSTDTIISIMKIGVFDYIIKPIDLQCFKMSIKKALEFKYLKDTEKYLIDSAALKIRSQLEWLNYKEDRRVKAKDYAEITSIYSLKTSLTQGTGFGSLLTMIDLIKTTKKESGDSYTISKEIIDLLLGNYDTCNAQLHGLHSISSLLEDIFPVVESSAAELIAEIPGMIKEIVKHFPRKDLRITYPELKTNCVLNLNMEKLSLIIEEIIINAYKYTNPGSTVNIFAYIKEGYFWLSIMNEIILEPYGGIPPKFERLVLEPFFRLLPVDETVGEIEKFGLGLGLTVVENIARKHGGMFMIHDVKDHTEGKLRPCVLAEILLPVIN